MRVSDIFKKKEKSPRLKMLEKAVKSYALGVQGIVKTSDGHLIVVPRVFPARLPKFSKYTEIDDIKFPFYEYKEVKHLSKELDKLPRI